VFNYDPNTDVPALIPSRKHAFITARTVIEEAKNNTCLYVIYRLHTTYTNISTDLHKIHQWLSIDRTNYRIIHDPILYFWGAKTNFPHRPP